MTPPPLKDNGDIASKPPVTSAAVSAAVESLKDTPVVVFRVPVSFVCLPALSTPNSFPTMTTTDLFSASTVTVMPSTQFRGAIFPLWIVVALVIPRSIRSFLSHGDDEVSGPSSALEMMSP